MTATKATENVICEIKTVSCPFEEGKPIIWLDDIKNNNKDRPKIISGITKGEELKKIKKGLAGIFDILVYEKPIITPIIVAKVADKEAIFILV